MLYSGDFGNQTDVMTAVRNVFSPRKRITVFPVVPFPPIVFIVFRLRDLRIRRRYRAAIIVSVIKTLRPVVNELTANRLQISRRWRSFLSSPSSRRARRVNYFYCSRSPYRLSYAQARSNRKYRSLETVQKPLLS